MKYFLLSLLLHFSGYCQLIDLTLTPKEKKKYPLEVTSIVQMKQTINGAAIEAKAKSTTKLSFAFGKEERRIFPVTLRYENASLQMQTIVNGQEMPLGKVPSYLNQAVGYLKGETFKGDISNKGKIYKFTGTTPILTNAIKTLEKKQPKDAPIAPFEREQVEAQLVATFGEATLQSNLTNVFAIFPSQKVRVGDSWEVTSSLSKDMDITIKTQYTLVEANDHTLQIRGKAIIQSQREKVILQQGQYIFFTMEGEVDSWLFLDPKTKWFQKGCIRQRVKGISEAEGDLSHPGKEIPFEGNSELLLNDWVETAS